jgi:hypothetical protein
MIFAGRSDSIRLLADASTSYPDVSTSGDLWKLKIVLKSTQSPRPKERG